MTSGVFSIFRGTIVHILQAVHPGLTTTPHDHEVVNESGTSRQDENDKELHHIVCVLITTAVHRKRCIKKKKVLILSGTTAVVVTQLNKCSAYKKQKQKHLSTQAMHDVCYTIQIVCVCV